MRGALLLALVPGWLVGCASLDRALYDTSSAVAPPHPVYGAPVFNVVREAQEVAEARRAWAHINTAVRQDGIAVDPPGERLARIRTIFASSSRSLITSDSHGKCTERRKEVAQALQVENTWVGEPAATIATVIRGA